VYGQANYRYQVPQLKGRQVTSVEEARAAQIDFDGSLFVFPDVLNGRIYTKQIRMDGTAGFDTYVRVEPQPQPEQPAYVTKEEFDRAMASIAAQMKGETGDQGRVEAVPAF
jgi:hypothetical protein